MPCPLDQQLQDMHRKLKTNSICVDSEWLSECVEHFINEEPHIGLQLLYDKTIEQWLLNDLSEIGVGCLPPTVNDKQQVMLTENYALQMQYIVDVSESAYDQLRRLHNQQLDETESEQQESKAYASRRKRALKMELTDGQTSVVAMEYRPIPDLHTKLSPGCKILVMGPVRCINKVLLLEPRNVKVLGGEVEKYVIENAFENVLLRQLDRPINPNPRTNYTEIPVVAEPHRPLPSQLSSRHAHNGAMDVDGMFGDDDLLLSIDLDERALASLVNDDVQPAQPPPPLTMSSSVSAFFDDDDDVDLLLVDPDAALLETHNHQIQFAESIDYETIDLSTQPSPPIQSNTITTSASRQWQSMDCTEAVRRPSPVQPVPEPSILDAYYAYKLHGAALVTIDQLNAIEDIAVKYGRCFMIKAEIKNVYEKLRMKNETWTVGVILGDTSATTLQVRIAGNVLNQMSGTSAVEVQEMRRRSKEQPQLIDEMKQILTDLKEQLETLNCFMKLQYPDSSGDIVSTDNVPEVPQIVELIDSAPVLERMLASKLCAEL